MSEKSHFVVDTFLARARHFSTLNEFTMAATNELKRSLQEYLREQADNIQAVDMRCTITHELPVDPVVFDGSIYEKTAIEEWLKEHPNTSPFGHKTINEEPKPPPQSVVYYIKFLREMTRFEFEGGSRLRGLLSCQDTDRALQLLDKVKIKKCDTGVALSDNILELLADLLKRFEGNVYIARHVCALTSFCISDHSSDVWYSQSRSIFEFCLAHLINDDSFELPIFRCYRDLCKVKNIAEQTSTLKLIIDTCWRYDWARLLDPVIGDLLFYNHYTSIYHYKNLFEQVTRVLHPSDFKHYSLASLLELCRFVGRHPSNMLTKEMVSLALHCIDRNRMATTYNSDVTERALRILSDRISVDTIPVVTACMLRPDLSDAQKTTLMEFIGAIEPDDIDFDPPCFSSGEWGCY